IVDTGLQFIFCFKKSLNLITDLKILKVRYVTFDEHVKEWDIGLKPFRVFQNDFGAGFVN
ncbi:hypothetical protein, partial [Acinetobacter baumannii]|uniref:hypothetical protein n=1 Tax=Acinetobacter baumannii TaxID=470 RepID=UPI001BC87074